MTEKQERGTAHGQEEKEFRVAFTIEGIEDISFGQVKRYNIRTRVSKQLDRAELVSISQNIIDQEKIRHPHNALSLLYYLPDADLDQGYTAGMVEWAPFGDWTRASEVTTGDYSKHELNVKTGNATGTDPKGRQLPRVCRILSQVCHRCP